MLGSQYLFLLTVVLGAASAVLTGLVTHVKAPAQLQALVLALWSLASGAIEQAAQAHGSFTWHGFLTAAWLAFVAGVIAHKGSLIAFITGPNGLISQKFGGGVGAPGTLLGGPPPAAEDPTDNPPPGA